ncbi:hypothetical protein HDU76_008869 [Blyttiomyces sp. JEL0837]|nr:hypothetical protein HDU76_008869 [Blyttiomyces sp. JEL0837]
MDAQVDPGLTLLPELATPSNELALVPSSSRVIVTSKVGAQQPPTPDGSAANNVLWSYANHLQIYNFITVQKAAASGPGIVGRVNWKNVITWAAEHVHSGFAYYKDEREKFKSICNNFMKKQPSQSTSAPIQASQSPTMTAVTPSVSAQPAVPLPVLTLRPQSVSTTPAQPLPSLVPPPSASFVPPTVFLPTSSTLSEPVGLLLPPIHTLSSSQIMDESDTTFDSPTVTEIERLVIAAPVVGQKRRQQAQRSVPSRSPQM